jgi:hypothetical protein
MRLSGRVFAKEELAVGAAEEECEAVQIGAERVQAVGRVADAGHERWRERAGVGGEPAGDELEGLGELALAASTSSLTSLAARVYLTR